MPVIDDQALGGGLFFDYGGDVCNGKWGVALQCTHMAVSLSEQG
jgi:hypothetical protein